MIILSRVTAGLAWLLAAGGLATPALLQAAQTAAQTAAQSTPPFIAQVSPPGPTPVNGPLQFSIDNPAFANLASVEYLVNGKRTGGPTQSPYLLQWHTAYLWNGNYSLEAVGRDSSGKEIVRSTKTAFTVTAQPGGVALTSPEILNTVLSGTVNITAAATLAPGKQIERMLIAIDGYQLPPYYESAVSYALDTSTLSNGTHEVVITAFDGAPIQSGAGTVQFSIAVDNGHTLQEIRSNWKTLYLAPGETVKLNARAVFTDGKEEAIDSGVSYVSDNLGLATVTADEGTVTAVAPGVDHILITALNQTIISTLVVDQPHGFAHFSGTGGIRQDYDANTSLFLRTVFFLDAPEALDRSPELGPELQVAGINALTQGLYLNPVSLGSPPDFLSWKSKWDEWWDGMVDRAVSNNVRLFFTGDDLARTAPILNNSIAGAYSSQAIQYAMIKARDSGLAIAMDMVDEVSALWGDTPAPTDGRWLKLQPGIPDDGFKKLMTIMNAVPNRTPISWPISGLHGGNVVRNWFSPAYSDYSSHYWGLLENRYVYPWDASLPQYRRNMDSMVDGRLPLIDRARPMVMLTTMAGDGYTKNGPGDAFVPGQDTIEVTGPVPLNVGTQIMYALARGMAGVRAYGYDGPAWKNQRTSSPAGTGSLQQGADPFGLGQDRWRAMAAAFNLIHSLEPDVLQPAMNAVDLGPDFVTGAKQGPDSRVLVAINFAERSQNALVHLEPYQCGAGTMERYRLLGELVRTDTVPATAYLQQEFEPGETVIWVGRGCGVTQAASQAFLKALGKRSAVVGHGLRDF